MYIKVKVIAGARREEVTVKSFDHWNVSVKEEAKNNRANDRILEIVRTKYPGKHVRIISGHHSRAKIIAIDD